MPNTGFLGWAYVTGSAGAIGQGADGKLAYYDGAGTGLNDAAGLLWDDIGSTLQITGTLDVSGTLYAKAFESVTVQNTTVAGTTSFGNDVSDKHQFSGSIEISGANSAGAGNGLLVESGRVGIGTLSPSYVLDVAGTFRSTGNSLFDANVTLGNAAADVTTVTSQLTASQGATFAAVVDITDTTDASDASGDTGALKVEGGASIAKKLYVGTDFSVAGGTTLGDAASDVTTITSRLTGSQGAYFATNVGIGTATPYNKLSVSGLATAVGFGNPSTMSVSMNIPANHNFRLFGPITIASGVDLHVGSGSEVKII